MEIRTVGVLGCGLMGSGIAQVAAARRLQDDRPRSERRRRCRRDSAASRSFSPTASTKGKVTEDAQNKTLGNLTGTTSTADLKDCDLVIEAIVENLDEKRADLPRASKPSVETDTIIVSNTSSLCITELGRRDAAAGSIRRPALLQSRCR